MVLQKMRNFFSKINFNIVLIIIAIVLGFFFLNQCNKTTNLKIDLEKQKEKTEIVKNNLEASQDSIRQYVDKNNTLIAEKQAYTLEYKEVKKDYQDLLEKYNIVKNRPPKTVVNTEYKIVESIREIPVSYRDSSLVFTDSSYFNGSKNNYRFVNGFIPIQFDTAGYKFGNLGLDLTIGMDLNVGLFKDEKTKKVHIQATTDYPGVTFTDIKGAYFLEDENNKKILRQARKQFGIGLHIGYGATYDIKANQIVTGPHVGLGFNWQPKFLQW